MSNQVIDEYFVSSVLRESKKYNVDEVLNYLFNASSLEELAEDLQNAYYYVAEWIADNGDYAGDEVRSTLVGLRSLTQAIKHSLNTTAAPRLSITVNR